MVRTCVFASSVIALLGTIALDPVVGAEVSDGSLILARGALRDDVGKIEVRQAGKADPVLVLEGKEGRCAFQLKTWHARSTLKSHIPIASLEGKRADCSPQWQARLKKADRVRGLMKPTGGSKPGALIFATEEGERAPAGERVSFPFAWVRLSPPAGEEGAKP